MKSVTVEENDSNQRLDKFLLKAFKNLPITFMYKAIRKKDIKVNSKRTDPKYKLQTGDTISLYIKDELLQSNKTPYDFTKAPAKIDILHEDSNILLINKPPGLIVHPDKNYHFDSLIDRIKHYLFLKKEYNPANEQTFTPALVNRLDRNTGGIVIAAKNAEALKILNEKMKNREIKKYYLTIVEGIFKKKEDTLTAYLEKNETKNRVYVYNKPREGFKIIKTKYKVLREVDGNSLIEIELLTGRTHQIRAHMAFIGHPILGDAKYGKPTTLTKQKFKYQALWAYKVEFKFNSGEPSYLHPLLNNKAFTLSDSTLLRR